jgi:hypothetical protein
MKNRAKQTACAVPAALIVTHGNTANRYRPLQGDTIILGRGRGCDLRLEAGDVSELHCLITRRPDGYHIRDCASRGGTRLNGETVQQAVLGDGDILQIGSFSFRVELSPCLSVEPSVQQAALGPLLARLQRSRRHLAQLALALRRRLRLERADRLTRAEDDLIDRHEELEQKAQILHAQLSACEHRARELEEAERELTRARFSMDAERQALDEIQRQLAERSAASPAENQYAVSVETVASSPPSEEADRELDIRRRELSHYAQHLQRTRRALEKEQAWLATAHQALAGQLREIVRRKEPATREEAGAAEEAAMSQVYIEALPPRIASTELLENMREQIATLTRQLAEKDALVEELCQQQQATAQVAEARTAAEMERYGAELDGVRRQLETDRQALELEVGQLKTRETELDETVRQEELQICRERTELARERAELNRLREQHRMDQTRAERERDLRRRFAGLQRNQV